MYLKHAARPAVLGGARASSVKRYRTVLDKFVAFALANGWRTWNEVTAQLLREYAGSLDGYEYATQYFELTTLKQVVKWLVDEGTLPQSARIRLPLTKPQGTSAYCWTMKEVTLILDFCRSKPELGWLTNVVTMLAMTGLRISELASLTWANIAPDLRTIHLFDESTRGRRVAGSQLRQTTKGKRDRSLPIHDEMRGMLVALPRSKDGYLFHGPKGGCLDDKVVREALAKRVLKPLAKEYGDAVGDRFLVECPQLLCQGL
jgi:integrase